MNYRIYSLIKLVFLIAALGLAWFLAFVAKDASLSAEHSIVFVMDVNRTMNTQDVVFKGAKISRLAAAKEIIRTTIAAEPGRSYGLILFNASADYMIPSTFDVETFLLYLTEITTNLLPDGQKDFFVLSSVVVDRDMTSYIVFSDFDTLLDGWWDVPDATLFVGLGTIEGDYMRYSNGVRYYLDGASMSSARNDSVARSLGASYMPVTTIDDFSPQKLIFGGVHLPVSQRVFLYVLLGVLVILTVML